MNIRKTLRLDYSTLEGNNGFIDPQKPLSISLKFGQNYDTLNQILTDAECVFLCSTSYIFMVPQFQEVMVEIITNHNW